MATSLAEHVSTLLLRAGFTASSPEIIRIREHNNRLFARAAAAEASRTDTAEWLKGRLAGRW